MLVEAKYNNPYNTSSNPSRQREIMKDMEPIDWECELCGYMNSGVFSECAECGHIHGEPTV